METTGEASGFGLLAILDFCEARYLIGFGFIGLFGFFTDNFDLLSALLDK